MVSKEVSEAIESGQQIVYGVAVLAISLGVILYVVTKLNETSNGALSNVVSMTQAAVAPFEGGLGFLGIVFVVIVAVLVLKVIRGMRA